jgi:hypothetical protein
LHRGGKEAYPERADNWNAENRVQGEAGDSFDSSTGSPLEVKEKEEWKLLLFLYFYKTYDCRKIYMIKPVQIRRAAQLRSLR